MGTDHGMETDLVPKAGYELRLIHAAGLKRGVSLKNIGVLLTLNKGVNECKKIIKEEKPELLIGTGGYVTAPLMIAGVKMKVPTMIHESNALPGKTTTWLSSKVDAVAVGFEAALEKLPKAKRAIYTGNPTKMNGLQKKEDAKSKLGIGSEPFILIFGGSQGAKKINETMVDLINTDSFNGCQIVYATGPKNYDDIMKQIKKVPENVKIERYIYNMEEMMAASDLLVCRSGALTTSEIGIVGVPAILIPFPYAAENHQYFNAKTLQDAGAGVILEEKDLTKELLLDTINNLIADKAKLDEMRKNAKATGNPQAIINIEKEIERML